MSGPGQRNLQPRPTVSFKDEDRSSSPSAQPLYTTSAAQVTISLDSSKDGDDVAAIDQGERAGDQQPAVTDTDSIMGQGGAVKKSPVARVMTMKDKLAEAFTKERAKKTASILSNRGSDKVGLQYKREDFENQIELDENGSMGDLSAITSRPSSMAGKMSTTELPQRQETDKGKKKQDDDSIGAIDEDLNDAEDEDASSVFCGLSMRSWSRFWRYIFPLLVALLAMCIGALVDSLLPVSSVPKSTGITLFGFSVMLGIGCVVWVIAQVCVHVLVKVYIRRAHALNYKLNYALRGSNKSMAFALWGIATIPIVYFVPWNCIVLPPGSQCNTENTGFTNTLQKFLFYLGICGMIFVVRLYFLKTMTFDFHQSAYLDRLKDFYFMDYVLGKLLTPAPAIFAALQLESPEMTDSISVSTGSRLTSRARQAMAFNVLPTGVRGVSPKDFTNSVDLANEIWRCVAGSKEAIRPEDFELFLAKKHRAQAWDLFDTDSSGDVTLDEVQRVAKHYLRERRNLRLSVKDHRTIVNKLSTAFTVGALAVCLLLFILFFADLAQTFVLPMLTTVAAFAFIFGSYAQNVFENSAFIFSQHPFDVGDRVFIDGDNYIVYQIEFSRTVFDRWDGHRVTYPNNILRTKVITNVRRSGPMSSFFTFHVWHGIKNKQIQEFERRLKAFVAEHSKDYFPETGVDIRDLQQDKRSELIFSVKHRSNFQDGKLRWARHTKVGMFAREQLEDLGIIYYPPVQNVEMKKVGDFDYNPFRELTSTGHC